MCLSVHGRGSKGTGLNRSIWWGGNVVGEGGGVHTTDGVHTSVDKWTVGPQLKDFLA